MSRRIAAVLALALAATAFLAVPALAGGGGHCDMTGLVAEATDTVGMDGACFTTTVAHIRPGQTVEFVNDSGVEHTVTGFGGWGDALPNGSTIEVAFDEAGVYPFFCAYHLGMLGAVVASDSEQPGLGITVPDIPETVADPVEEAEDTVDDATGEVEDAVTGLAAASNTGGPSTGAIAVLFGGLGLSAGLILRGRLRVPEAARARVPAS